MNDKYEQLCLNVDFLVEVQLLLAEMKIVDKLGLSLILHTELDYDQMTLVEGTSITNRWQEMHPKKNNSDVISRSVITHWIYDSKYNKDDSQRKHTCACVYTCIPDHQNGSHNRDHHEYPTC